MGVLIDLGAWRERAAHAAPAEGEDDPVARLDRVVARLDPLMEEATRASRRDPALETDILAITGALSLGLVDEAGDRAERLAARLEARMGRSPHPAGRGMNPTGS